MIDAFFEAIRNTSTFTKILWLIIIGWAIWETVQYFRRKKAATALTNEEFNDNLRKVQLIDVRNRDEYNAGHILGARNIPFTEMKQRHVELRKDQPVYIYEDGKYIAYRAAIELKKNGHEDISILEGGYKNWEGRIKRKKKIED